MVSSPAADAVTTKQPRPRSSQPGSSSRDARTWARTLTSQARCQTGSGVSGPVPDGDPGVGAVDVDLAQVLAGGGDELPHALLGRRVAGHRVPADLVRPPPRRLPRPGR